MERKVACLGMEKLGQMEGGFACGLGDLSLGEVVGVRWQPLCAGKSPAQCSLA